MALKTLDVLTCSRPYIDILALCLEEFLVCLLTIRSDRLLVLSVNQRASNVVQE